MAKFFGREDGAPRGLPFEAVVADLCELRTDVRQMATQVYDLKQTLIAAQEETLAVMKQILTATTEATADAHEFRKDMIRLGAAVLENTNANSERAASLRGPDQA